jgi:hypothetical protein
MNGSRAKTLRFALRQARNPRRQASRFSLSAIIVMDDRRDIIHSSPPESELPSPQRAVGEWNAMLFVSFHALGGNGPYAVSCVDLASGTK